MATANDKLQDESIAHAIWVSRYSTGVANRMIKVLNDSDAELTARLLVAIDTLDAESFTVSRLEALLVSVRAINKDAIQSMYAALTAELQELAKHEATFQMSLFQFAIPDDVLALHPLVGISPDAVYAAAMGRPFQGRLLSEWASNLEADRMARISNTVRQGFLLGDTQEQIAKRSVAMLIVVTRRRAADEPGQCSQHCKNGSRASCIDSQTKLCVGERRHSEG